MHILLDLLLVAVIVAVIYAVDFFFYRRKPSRKPEISYALCSAAMSDASGTTQGCCMVAYHTGPHRLHNGEAFSTAKRKQRELNKAVNRRVDEITEQAFPE